MLYCPDTTDVQGPRPRRRINRSKRNSLPSTSDYLVTVTEDLAGKLDREGKPVGVFIDQQICEKV